MVRWSETDDTVDPTVSVEAAEPMVKMGFLTLRVCTEYEYAETPKHTHTHTHTHTYTHTDPYCLFTHEIFGSVKHLFDEATLEILDSYPNLPAKPETE